MGKKYETAQDKKIAHENFVKKRIDLEKYMKDKYIIKWLDGVKDQRLRVGVFKKYCDFLEKTPEILINEHHADLITEPINRTDITKKQMFGFFYYLVGENDKNTINDKVIPKTVSWNASKQYVFSKIASFYKRNGVPVTFNKSEAIQDRKNKREKTWRNGDDNARISTEMRKDWLKKIYNQLKSVKNKTILLCKISSGLDDVDLFNLKMRDFNRGYFKEFNICYIEGNRQKTQFPFQTCFSSEACDSLHTYIKDRERKGEKITDNSWLFVVDKKYGKNYSQMKRTLFYDQLLETCKVLNLKNITPKSLRRYYESNGSKDLDTQSSGLFKLTMGHSAVLVGAYQQISHEQESFVKWYKENIESKILILGRSEYIKEANIKMERINETISSQAKKIASLEKMNEIILKENAENKEENAKIKAENLQNKEEYAKMKAEMLETMNQMSEMYNKFISTL
ncbi:tyrosine-type recombinase/integrase [Promethearchaeum syntrophicum]|uniref:Tyrosine-type recombinase/integrase n=1 Tax=Promethearchaeum syntrophicum TaxID=2594042 RepID=A0A5B9DC54_9ARCH|nr:tyrosine-type recombinase/integrase [Candidatus Prometheoarchaeum syntrophicum]QEE16447.1 hypothetical protein DSAG12_02277 [Candidatus Prometheoarchaeum syntrophicum]